METSLIRLYLFAGPVLAAVLFVVQGLTGGRKFSLDSLPRKGMFPATFLVAAIAFGRGWDHYDSLMWGLTYAVVALIFEGCWLFTLWVMIAEATGRKQLRKKRLLPYA